MQSRRLQREQTKSEPVLDRSQRDRTGTPVSHWPPTLNDAHSPALRLSPFALSHTRLSYPLQAKLTVSEPGDQYEQEADRVAERVMRMPVPAIRLQRKCGCGGATAPGESCEECASSQPLVQRHAGSSAASSATAPAIVHEVLGSPGHPLDSSSRAFMEPRFGHDFSGVRVHTDTRAAESARAVNALAYTVGRDVVFDFGQYAPNAVAGKKLLAHELSHVVQQGGLQRSVQRQVDDRGCPTREHHEVETSHSNAGFLSPDVTVGSGRLHIADFGIDWRHVKPTTRSDPLLVSWLNTFETDDSYRLRIIGFSDCFGPSGINIGLRQHRAENVERLLGPRARARVTFRGMQALGQYVHPNNSVQNRARNRSVVIEFSRDLTFPPEEITLTRHRFRAAAWSFLSCAECNPFTDDGALGLTPPATEGAGSSFRQMHFIEAAIGTYDGRTIASGSARLVAAGRAVGISHFCGTGALAHIVSSGPPSTPTRVTHPIHGEGIQFQSVLSSRVGASVPATLPGSPCGPLGTNPLIPVIGNAFRMRLFADGTKESEFASATLYPSHYLYEDRALKLFGGTPVHPRQDFFAWASATVPLAIGLVGFKALRFHCCHPTMSRLGCATMCASGFSVPAPIFFDPARCAIHGTALAAMSCPAACAPAGSSCAPIVRGPNP